MSPEFTVHALVSRPLDQVREAVVDPGQLSRYFTTGGARGRLEAGATVWWDFHDFPGEFPVEVIESGADRLVLRWEASETTAEGTSPRQTTVTFRFSTVAQGRTRVEISERGWSDSDEGLRASYGNCMGWSQMLCALKVWLEHGLNLRDGLYA